MASSVATHESPRSGAPRRAAATRRAPTWLRGMIRFDRVPGYGAGSTTGAYGRGATLAAPEAHALRAGFVVKPFGVRGSLVTRRRSTPGARRRSHYRRLTVPCREALRYPERMAGRPRPPRRPPRATSFGATPRQVDRQILCGSSSNPAPAVRRLPLDESDPRCIYIPPCPALPVARASANAHRTGAGPGGWTESMSERSNPAARAPRKLAP